MVEEKRVQWNSNFGFLMAMIGSAVGLGNIWRFPYILYTNGLGTFMIPYIVAILVLGFSFLLVEYSVGYKFKTSFLKAFETINKKFKPFGWFVCLVIFFIVAYYTVIVGWDLIYMILSFFKGWGSQPDSFLVNNVLQATDSFSGILTFVPCVFIAALVVWFLVWFISHRGINDGVSKFSEVAVPLLFGLVILIVLFSLTLNGASFGYSKMFTPDWSALANLDIWLAAFGQIIFSLSLGMAIVLTYASYLPENSNLVKNAIIVMCSNSGFEVFNAVGVFSILGFMAVSTGIPFDSLITEGTGLAFVAYPQVFNIMGPAAYVIGPIFFACIFIAGLTSAIALVEPVAASLKDALKISRKRAVNIIAICGFLVTILFTTGAGSAILTVFDRFLNNFALLFAIIIECIAFGWLYKIDDLLEVLNENTPFRIGNWWKYVIKYLLPILLSVLWINGILNTIEYGDFMSLTIEISLFIVLLVVPFILSYIENKRKGEPETLENLI